VDELHILRIDNLSLTMSRDASPLPPVPKLRVFAGRSVYLPGRVNKWQRFADDDNSVQQHMSGCVQA
jgi:hypothetical protein